MPLSRRTLLRYASALSATSALGCGDDAPPLDGSGTESSTSSGPGSEASTGAPLTSTAVDSSSSSGVVDDGLPHYEWEGEVGPESLFSHGVASGDPLTDAVILWTRITIESTDEVEAFFEVALDPQFEMRVAADYLETDPGRDQTIKLDVQNLSAGTTYYYRFYAHGRVSAIGRTRTAPTDATRLRVATCSCSNYSRGYFHIYRRIAERADLDLVLHLGDYIYEAGVNPNHIRPVEPEHELIELDDYRMRYATYRTDPDLQELHRQHPVVVTWDDHESANDAYKDNAQNHTPSTEGSWEDRKAAAAQAHAEWMPMREGMPGIIYRALPYSDLMHLIMLDTRIVGRDLQPDDLTDPELLDDPDRQLLGMAQESWVMEQFASTEAQWVLIGQQVIMAEVRLGDNPINADQWDGYRAARARFYEMADAVSNLVVLTGDIHSSWAFDLAVDPRGEYDPKTGEGSVGVEFVTPGVTSAGFPTNAANAALVSNPHLHWAELTQRGYVVLDIDSERVQASWWFIDDVESPDGDTQRFEAAWAVYDGTRHLVQEDEPADAREDAPVPAP
ncbi:MAG: alkaline phosphatase D family protein [Nannocystales bacterium]